MLREESGPQYVTACFESFMSSRHDEGLKINFMQLFMLTDPLEFGVQFISISER